MKSFTLEQTIFPLGIIALFVLLPSLYRSLRSTSKYHAYVIGCTHAKCKESRDYTFSVIIAYRTFSIFKTRIFNKRHFQRERTIEGNDFTSRVTNRVSDGRIEIFVITPENP